MKAQISLAGRKSGTFFARHNVLTAKGSIRPTHGDVRLKLMKSKLFLLFLPLMVPASALAGGKLTKADAGYAMEISEDGGFAQSKGVGNDQGKLDSILNLIRREIHVSTDVQETSDGFTFSSFMDHSDHYTPQGFSDNYSKSYVAGHFSLEVDGKKSKFVFTNSTNPGSGNAQRGKLKGKIKASGDNGMLSYAFDETSDGGGEFFLEAGHYELSYEMELYTGQPLQGENPLFGANLRGSLQAVPEPAPILALGLGGLALLRRRKA